MRREIQEKNNELKQYYDKDFEKQNEQLKQELNELENEMKHWYGFKSLEYELKK